MIQRSDNKIVPLIDSALTLTTSWQDLGALVPGGPEINVMDCMSVTLWLKVDINDSQNVRVRMVGIPQTGSSDLYNPPIMTVNASIVRVEPEVIELNVDADQNILLSFPTVDQVPLIKFQVQVGTLGATAGTLTGAGVSFKSNVPFGG